jgi:hypothetical protein
MKPDCFTKGFRSAVMQQKRGAALRALSESNAPERCGPPFRRQGVSLGVAIVQLRAHVVKEQVGVRVKLNPAQRGDIGLARSECGHVAADASDSSEQLPSRHNVGIVGAPTRRRPKRAQIEDDAIQHA